MAVQAPIANDRRAASLKQNVADTGPAIAKKRRSLKGVGNMRKLDLCPFTQKLAAMLDAGLPLVQCMDALSEQTITPEFKVIVKDIGARIEAGQSFSEALEYYTELFGELYVSMIRAGEMGGGLAEVMARLAAYMENSMAMARKVKSAMTYPVMVLGMALLPDSLLGWLMLFMVFGSAYLVYSRLYYMIYYHDIANHFFAQLTSHLLTNFVFNKIRHISHAHFVGWHHFFAGRWLFCCRGFCFGYLLIGIRFGLLDHVLCGFIGNHTLLDQLLDQIGGGIAQL